MHNCIARVVFFFDGETRDEGGDTFFDFWRKKWFSFSAMLDRRIWKSMEFDDLWILRYLISLSLEFLYDAFFPSKKILSDPLVSFRLIKFKFQKIVKIKTLQRRIRKSKIL